MKEEVTKFGPGQISKETPEWAKWAFRIFFYGTSTVSLYLSIFTSIPSELKMEILKGTAFANLAAHGLSKMFGITIEDVKYYDNENPK